MYLSIILKTIFESSMKNTIRLTGLTLLVLFSLSCLTQKKLTGPDHFVAPLSDTTIIREGTLIYSLPMTVFTVTIVMERNIELPGPYAKYAGELLGLDDVIMDEGEHWSIENVSVDSHEEIDPSEFYVIESKSPLRTNALALKKEGVLLDINPGSNPERAGLIEGGEINLDQFRSYDLGSDEYYATVTDTAYRRVKADDQFIRIPYIVETKKKLSENQLAERAARRLMDLRDGKLLILTGEANVFPQSDAAINEINRMEKEYTELFTGKTITEMKRFTFQVIPEKDKSEETIPIFRFSEVKGPVNTSSETDANVTITLIPEQKTKDLTVITVAGNDPQSPRSDKLYYRMPDIVKMTIKIGDDTLYESRKLVYQFGEILQLPSYYIIGK